MDELVNLYYRKLCREGFPHTGSLEQPSIFLDTVGEKIRICSRFNQSYIHIYINISHDIIHTIKYLCTCDPATNVAVETLCYLIEGKTVKEAGSLTEESFSQVVGSRQEEFLKKARGVIELLHRGIERFQAQSVLP